MASGYQNTNNTLNGTTYNYMIPKQPTLYDLLNNQFFLGFQEQINRWNALTPAKILNFPPYNLIKPDENSYIVELAVAGYTKDDVEITVEKDLLVVKSVEKKEQPEAEVLHQGIAKRLWTQQFVLGEYMVVKDAKLKDGLLTINIERELPEELKPKTIKIK